MREQCVAVLDLEDACGRMCQCAYSIVTDQLEDSPRRLDSYGIKIAERESGTVAVVPHITCSQARIEQLCQLVVRNGVTPLSLKDVVLDWL
ncbi:MAG TPA: hypothetical protein DIT49_06005 [Clostridiales bacterium]|nr:hypothetical protein [Clostridiales bacterium]